MAEYLDISFSEMETLLKRLRYCRYLSKKGREIGFAKFYKDFGLAIIVWTGFDKYTEKQRGYGEDAIRVLLCDLTGDKVYFQLKRVMRIAGWKNQLVHRLALLEQVVATYMPCPTCLLKREPTDERPPFDFARCTLTVKVPRKKEKEAGQEDQLVWSCVKWIRLGHEKTSIPNGGALLELRDTASFKRRARRLLRLKKQQET